MTRRKAITIGHIDGIPIQMYWSWAFVALLVAAGFSQIYAATINPQNAWPLAIIATLLLTASIGLHEAGHALVARWKGVRVRAIGLFAMGGATEIEDEWPDPVRDLLIAIGGPFVSLVLAALSGLIWWQVRTPISLVALHLAYINLALALFNLLPGYPLDGGRVLKAVIWFLTDDELYATHIAVWIGRACGWICMLLSLWYVATTGDLLNAIWIGMIGYFLSRTSMDGYRQVALRHALQGVIVADLMCRVYRAVGPDLSLEQFVGRYVLGQIDQGFPVLAAPEDDTPQPLLGMMTMRNLRSFNLSQWDLIQVAEAMTPTEQVHSLNPAMSAGEALRMLIESGEEHLPVIGEQTLLGVLSRRDLVRYVQARLSRR